MRTALLAIVLATLALGSGCASIVSGANQSISVEARSEGGVVKNATCKLTNDKGTWYVDTPGSVTVHRSYDDLSVRCDKEKYDPGIATVKSSTKAMMFGNILFGGIIGGAVDAGTGAGYDYPALVSVQMGQTTTIEAPPQPAQAGAPEDAKTVQAAALAAQPALQRGVPRDANAPPAGALADGALWMYAYTEQMSATRRKIGVRADHVDRDFVEESVFQPESDAAIVRRTVSTRDTQFLRYSVGKDNYFVEFAPYLLRSKDGKQPEKMIAPAGYAVTGYDGPFIGSDWQTDGHLESWERMYVPAGTFRAAHYRINGRRSVTAPAARQMAAIDRYQVDIWYAAEVGRIIKLEHRTWGGGRMLSNELVELVEYRAPH